MTRLEEENSRLRSEIDLLSVRLKEIDRLKQLEDLIQSQVKRKQIKNLNNFV